MTLAQPTDDVARGVPPTVYFGIIAVSNRGRSRRGGATEGGIAELAKKSAKINVKTSG
jgi:hypothetical protein